MIFLLSMCLAMSVQAVTVLWAALDESSVVDENGSIVPFREYVNGAGQFVNAARLVTNGNPIPLWIPEWDGDPGYWEEDFPVTCLKDEDGEYSMGKRSSQFNLGNKPDTSMAVIFELGYVADWDDESSSFITLATAQSTIGELIDGNYTYPSGTIYPPTQENWMPTIFYADSPIPEPSSVSLFLSGLLILMLSRKRSA